MTQYMLVDATSGKREVLQVGKNVIGRNTPVSVVDGVSFIGLESPFSTISRLQAVIEVASNGDAWVSDCNSTNGTFLAVNTGGDGIRLDPHRFYQLKPKNRIIFGDVEMLFDVGESSTNGVGDAKTAVTVSMPSSLDASLPINPSAGHSENTCASNDTGVLATTAINTFIENHTKTTEPNLNGVDLHASPGSVSRGGSNQRKECAPCFGTPGRVVRKRGRSNSDLVSQKVDSKLPFSPQHRLHWVCFSGMDGNEKGRAQKLAKKIGWKMTEKILGADVLVVGTPVARTPKFLIAVGRGIPVVTEAFLENGDISKLKEYVPSLSHGVQTYSASSLKKVIFRSCKTPVFQGVSFNLSGLPQKVRRVAREIVVGCGGEVARGQPEGAFCLSEENLDGVYDSVLRGKMVVSITPTARTKKTKK